MKYARQLGKVTDFIGKNLDEELSLEKLSEIACFSKYHFHRLFTVFTGLSLQQYIYKQGEIMLDVAIKNITARRLAVVEHKGPVEKLGDSLEKLIDWSKSQAINLKPKAGDAFGFGYHDPKTTNPEDFRFDLGITVPEQLKLNGAVIEKRIPAGRYAVALHRGSRDNIGDTVYALYRDWLPNSGEELDDFPCIFCYHNFDHEVAETEALTECWLLLK